MVGDWWWFLLLSVSVYIVTSEVKQVRLPQDEEESYERAVKDEEESYERAVKDEEESYERAVKDLREYFSSEVTDNDDLENLPDIFEEPAFGIVQDRSLKSKKSRTGPETETKKSKRNLDTIDESEQIEYENTLNQYHKSTKRDFNGTKRNLKGTKRYLNEWVVHMSGGEEVAKRIASELGYNLEGSVRGFEDVYRVSHRRQHHNHKRETEEITKQINSHIEVLWAEQQFSSPRVKRSASSQDERNEHFQKSSSGMDKRSVKPLEVNETEKGTLEWINYQKAQENRFNDPLWKHQWYLFDTRTRGDLPEIDLKVIPVWDSGITGKGVNVVVVDDGLEWNHTDIINNYNANISYDLNDDDVDPTPRYDRIRTNSHGTKCAGEIAMQPNNGKCGVGVAYGASIGGIRMLDGEVTDRIEGAALAIGRDIVDVMSCSWGPTDDGTRVEGPGRLAQMALKKGVKEGRDGKGIIFVWASGNGGMDQDNCNCDGYASSIYTVSVNTASEDGRSPWYSEHCASTLTSTYSSGAYSDQKIATADIENDCTVSFTGTSASAPLAAGIIALALEANPSMTWRDIQHAVVTASDWKPLSRDDGWQTNGAGLRFNIKFGFGLLLADPLVKAARNWTHVPPKTICITQANIGSGMSIKSGGIYNIDITPQCNSTNAIKHLEHVQILLTLNHSKRGSLMVTLTSPRGTTTSLLTPRPSDDSTDGFCDWPLTSVHTWGEDPTGIWRLSVNDTSVFGQKGTIISVSLILHGTIDLLL